MLITLIFVPRGGEIPPPPNIRYTYLCSMGGEIPPPPQLNFKFKNLIWKFISPTDERRPSYSKV